MERDLRKLVSIRVEDAMMGILVSLRAIKTGSESGRCTYPLPEPAHDSDLLEVLSGIHCNRSHNNDSLDYILVVLVKADKCHSITDYGKH